MASEISSSNDLNDEIVSEVNEVNEVEAEVNDDVDQKSKTKRGRKSKTDKKDIEQVEKVQRIRGRKKKYDIDSIKKLKLENEGSVEKVVFSSKSTELLNNTDNLNNNIKETQISFGRLNIGIQTTSKIDSKELRRQMDINFGISENDKAPEVLSQETGSKSSEFVIRKAKPSNERETYQAPETVMMKHNDDEIEDVTTEVEDVKDATRAVIKDTTEVVKKKSRKTNITKKIHKVLGNEVFEKWPEKTNLLCWWCCHNFTSNPVPCPIGYDKITDKFKVRGIFCGWPCATSYSMNNFKEISNIYLFRHKMNDIDDISDIYQAPDKIVLKNFGGFMTIDEFRAFGTVGIESGKKNHKIIISTDHISYSNQEILEFYSGK